MSEWRVEVIEVGEIHDHKNAERLEITHVNEYPVIVGKGEFKTGDKAIYVSSDSVVPTDDPRFAFLGKHNRIRPCKLRGVFSMGLLVKADPEWKVGQDVSELLGITKYEPPLALQRGGEDGKDPGFLPVYTDIEGYRRWPDALQEGEEVILSEKIHGCLNYATTIVMADFSKMRIGDLVNQGMIGEEVLGINEAGQIVPNKILNIFKNGPTDSWLKVKGTRSMAGRGSWFFAITCTSNHRFWSGNRYIEANKLKPGMPVTLLRSEAGITPLQRQVLLGKMLGDGRLHHSPSGICAAVDFSHKEEHRDYLMWTIRALGDLGERSIGQAISGHGTEMARSGSLFNVWIREYLSDFDSVYKGKYKKVVPQWVVDELNPISLSFWYMDDGSLGSHKDQEDRANFAVCDFSKEDCEILIRALSKFGIESVLQTDTRGYNGLRLNADEAEKLFLIIAPYIHPVMQYKLPPRYRGHPGWLPQDQPQGYKPLTVEQTILSVEPVRVRSKIRYDIETETGNFFANGVLVHNSNGRWLWRDDRLWAGSHKRIKKENPAVRWWKIAQDYELASKLKTIPNIAIYGEVYGEVKNFKYGTTKDELRLAVFDALDTITRRYLDYDEFLDIVKVLDLPAAPILFKGPWSKDLLELSNGNSTIEGADNIREGFVVRPIKERFDERISRVILKVPGEDYLLGKKKRKEEKWKKRKKHGKSLNKT